ncbi:helix-turn-helix domain-containing protein [Bradyrhizobium sp. 33ap4]|uniref:helix-turn-helix domain-containing protein n=1 Tax=Bradyrhizobium sp. 33ap4 TaxID=3061630 RepID=UPI00293061D3|nr:helix-turn-helix domain-containing protein [Bradyrhizobium sp. 33ap4]
MDTAVTPTVARHSLREKWDYVIDPGFLALPYVLLLHQAEMGLSSENLNVLLNFLAHWHAEGRLAYPHTNTIAKRMGVSKRSVQRSVSWLVKEGFLAKLPKRNIRDRQVFDLTPLVEKLKPFAWARIQLMQQRRREADLSDELIKELSRPPRPTGVEMFAEATRQGINIGSGYPIPVQDV